MASLHATRPATVETVNGPQKSDSSGGLTEQKDKTNGDAAQDHIDAETAPSGAAGRFQKRVHYPRNTSEGMPVTPNLQVEDLDAAIDAAGTTSSDHPKQADLDHSARNEISASQVIENVGPLDTEKAPHTPLKKRFRWIRVNLISWKLTDGEFSNVPRSHGQWPGYRTEKAVAWVIDVGSPVGAPAAWLARCGEWACGPEPLNEAKTDAMAMAKGAVGCWCVDNSTDWLDRLQAFLLDHSAESASSGAA